VPWRALSWVSFTALVNAGCSSDPPAPSGSCAALDAFVAMTSDASGSSLGAFGLDGCVTPPQSTVDLGRDPQLAVSRGRYFFIARDTDRIFELDLTTGRAARSFNVNDPDRAGVTNPQDLAVAADGALFVPRFNVPSVAVFEAAGARRANVDLAPYDDEDRNPNASAIQIVDVGGVEKAFVTLGRLDDRANLASSRPSQMLRIDVASAKPEGVIELVGRNPFNTMVAHEGTLWLAMPGTWDHIDEPNAGIERFDPITNTSRLVVTEHDLGGSVTNIALARGCGAAIVADPTQVNATSVVTFDPNSGNVFASASTPLLASDGFDLLAIAWRGDVLLVGDKRSSPHGFPVHAFDRTGTCDLHQRPDAIFLPEPPIAVRTH